MQPLRTESALTPIADNTITIAFTLLDALHPLRRDQDRQLEARFWLADRIQAGASKATLGSRFRGVEVHSAASVLGPGVVMFFFETRAGTDRASDIADRFRLVSDFVKGLAH
jgi:hypothetical protein